jgi:uncharacterized protein YgbK (DUF1537 family)
VGPWGILAPVTDAPRSRSLHVIADDLSGAAECAAALAQASAEPARLVLKGPLPAQGSWVVDSDSRAMDAEDAAECVVRLLREADLHRAPGDLLFKKIDSTLRGHVAGELAAALACSDVVQAAVVCSALPTQGRTVRKGVLHVHGQPQRDATGEPIEITRLLAPAGAQPLLLDPKDCRSGPGLARELLHALEQGTRVIAVDASDAEDLRRLALAIVVASRTVRLLAVGAAGLAKALATELLQAGAPEHPMLPTGTGHPPIVGVVASFSPVTRHQVDGLDGQAGVHVGALSPVTWFDSVASQAAVAQAQAHVAEGDAVMLCADREVPESAARQLAERMAEAVEPLARTAGTLVLTGGDAARAVLDRLGIERLEVLGELEPGICLSRHDAQSVVTKGGGFGDAQSLARVLRHLRAGRVQGT